MTKQDLLKEMKSGVRYYNRVLKCVGKGKVNKDNLKLYNETLTRRKRLRQRIKEFK